MKGTYYVGIVEGDYLKYRDFIDFFILVSRWSTKTHTKVEEIYKESASSFTTAMKQRVKFKCDLLNIII